MALKKDALKAKVEAERTQTATTEEKEIAKSKRRKVSDTTAPTPEQPQKKPNKRITHKVFSFWADRQDIARWQAYLKANTELKTVEELGTYAINEYINNHYPEGKADEAFRAMTAIEQQKAEAERKEAEKKYSK